MEAEPEAGETQEPESLQVVQDHGLKCFLFWRLVSSGFDASCLREEIREFHWKEEERLLEEFLQIPGSQQQNTGWFLLSERPEEWLWDRRIPGNGTFRGDGNSKRKKNCVNADFFLLSEIFHKVYW